MLIMLNIPGDYATALIYAEANHERDQPYHVDGKAASTIKFHHTPDARGLNSAPLPDVHDNDRYITFESDVPFHEFCDILTNSEYNDPKKYTRWHNCAHGTAFALKAADIRLPIPNLIIFNRTGDRINQRIPACTLTPADIYQCAKQHKLTLLKASGFKSKYEIAKLSLFSIAKRQKNAKLINDIEHLINADKDYVHAHPEHGNMHLQVLINTIDLLCGTNKVKSLCNSYALVHYHDHRDSPPWPGIPINASLNLLTLSLLYMAANYAITGNLPAIAPAIATESLTNDVAIGTATGCLIGGAATYLSLTQASKRRAIKPTEFSDALEAVSNEVHRSWP